MCSITDSTLLLCVLLKGQTRHISCLYLYLEKDMLKKSAANGQFSQAA